MPYSLAFFYLVVEPLLLFVLLPVWLMPTSPPRVLEGRQKAFFFFSRSAESGFFFRARVAVRSRVLVRHSVHVDELCERRRELPRAVGQPRPPHGLRSQALEARVAKRVHHLERKMRIRKMQNVTTVGQHI